MSVGEMVRDALKGQSVATIASETSYSPDAIYKAIEGKRRIPRDARPHLAKLRLLAGLAVALEGTGYNCFEPLPGDKHFLAMIEKVRQELHRLVNEVDILPQHLVDKLRAGDLAPEDRALLENVDEEMVRLLRALFSFLVEAQDQYGEPVTAMLANEKAPLQRRP